MRKAGMSPLLVSRTLAWGGPQQLLVGGRYHARSIVDEQVVDHVCQSLAGGTLRQVDGADVAIDMHGADAAAGGQLIAAGKAEPMEMRGRQMTGWLRVDADAVRTKRQLSTWVGRALAYTRALSAKR